MKSRILLLTAATLALLTALYALAGFVLLPRHVLREAPNWLKDSGHRLSISELRFNPFTLDASATGITIADADGKPVFSAVAASANVEWTSLARRAPVLASVEVTRPELNVEIDEQGRVNLAKFAADDGKASSGLPRFYIGRLAIEDGVIAFADRRERYENRFQQLSLELSALSTLEGSEGSYTLTAQTADGAQLQWQGELSLQPLALQGKLTVGDVALPALAPYLDAWLAAPPASGQAALQLPHRFLIQDGKPQFIVQDGSATVSGLALQTPTGDKTAGNQDATPSLKLDKLAITGARFDLQGRDAGAQLLRIGGLAAAMQRKADGSLDITSLLKPRPATAAGGGKPSGEARWGFRLDRTELAGARLEYADAPSGLAVAVENLQGHADAYAADGKELSFDVSGGVRGGGKLALRGKFTPQDGGFSSRIEATGLPVTLLQPLVARNRRLTLASGEATLAGDLQVGGKDAKFRYAGSLSVNNVAVNEAGLKPAASSEGARLLGWKSFATDKLTLTLSPDRLDVDELRLVAPVGQLAIAPDRSVNFGRAFATVEEPKDKPAAPEPAAAAGPAPAGEQGGFAFDIRRLRISNGNLDFSDKSLALEFGIAIQELAGVFNGLSSRRDSRSQFSLEGKVGEFGFARLTGSVNPYGWRDNTTLRAEFRNVDMAKVSPYSITFAGYSIASGRLSLDLRYRISNSLVEGDNRAVFDQLVLGARMESPRAMDLPLELAISLLKDDNGRIDIAIPVTGSLDDPKFDYGALIRQAIGSVISRIVTAPFRALASLFGGGSKGEEAGSISFEPGQARLLPHEREKLQRVAQGLEKRAELKVEIPGRADSQVDSARLKREALSREIARRSGFDVAEDESAGGVSIADARTRSAIRDLYAERFGQAELDKQRAQAEAEAAKAEAGKPGVLDRLKNLATGEPQLTNPRPFYQSLMRRLRDNQPLPQGALEQLAQARAQNIAAALKQSGVAEDRVSTSVAAPTSQAQAKEVTVELSLAKR